MQSASVTPERGEPGLKGCRRAQSFWGLGRPKMYHEDGDTPVRVSRIDDRGTERIQAQSWRYNRSRAGKVKDTMSKQRSFRMLRFFSLTGLVGVFVAAILLMLIYRQFAISHMISLSEDDISELATSLFNSVRREFMPYLKDETAHHLHPPLDTLQQGIGELVANTQVLSVRILDDEGVIISATNPVDIGRTCAGKPGVVAALAGDTVSWLTGPDDLEPPSRPDDDRHSFTTYFPIHGGSDGRVLGVFSVDTNMTARVKEIEWTQSKDFAGSLLILLLLYAVQIGSARYAKRMTELDEASLRERSRGLALLSEQLMTASESEKQRIAFELHEGVAQGLYALKIRVEGLCGAAGPKSVRCSQISEMLLPLILEMAQGIRALALEIRPPSLDDFGVLPTLDWYFCQFRQAHPSLAVEWSASIGETEIPKPLKTALYRLVEDVTKFLVREKNVKHMRVEVGKVSNKIVLEVLDDGSAEGLDPTKQAQLNLYHAALKERISLSGGVGRTLPNAWGGTTLHAEWPA